MSPNHTHKVQIFGCKRNVTIQQHFQSVKSVKIGRKDNPVLSWYRQCISPVALLHQPLSLLLAGVLLSFVGMEEDLQGRWAPLEPVPAPFPGFVLLIHRSNAMFGVGEFWKEMVVGFSSLYFL